MGHGAGAEGVQGSPACGVQDGDPGAGGGSSTAPAWLCPQAGPQERMTPSPTLHPTCPSTPSWWQPHAVLHTSIASGAPSCPRSLAQGPGSPFLSLCQGAHMCTGACSPRLSASFTTSIKDEKSHSHVGSQSQPLLFFLFFNPMAGARLPSTSQHPSALLGTQAAGSKGPWPCCPMGCAEWGWVWGRAPQSLEVGAAWPQCCCAGDSLQSLPMHGTKAAPTAMLEPRQQCTPSALPAPHIPRTEVIWCHLEEKKKKK